MRYTTPQDLQARAIDLHPALRTEHVKPITDPLYVVTSISNPHRYYTRYKLYQAFERHMECSGAVLYTIELATRNRHFEVTDHNNPRHIQLRTPEILWHKENLLNIAVKHLPEDWRYVAWIDADIMFTRPNWVYETLHQLQVFRVVQMFSHAIDLGPEYQPLLGPPHGGSVYTSFAYAFYNNLPWPTMEKRQRHDDCNSYYQMGGHHWHPGYCIQEGTLVSPGGKLAAASKRWFEGDMVVIRTAAGNELAVTPNHPILTRDRDWQSASDINVGDYVFSQCEVDGSASQRNPQQIPSLVEDVARSFSESPGVSGTSVPMRAEHFHGDGSGSKVAVVWANGLLRRVGESEFVEDFGERDFGTVLLSDPLLCKRSSVSRALHSEADAFGNSRPLFGRVSGPAELVSFGGATQQAAFFQPFRDSGPADAECPADLSDGRSGSVQSSGLGNFSGGIPSREFSLDGDVAPLQNGVSGVGWHADDSGSLLNALAGQVKADKVVYVGRRPFAGHVYNFSTERGYIIAGRIITHNCTAWRRSAYNDVHGWGDIGILGSSDHHMMCALVGRVRDSIPLQMHPNYLKYWDDWQELAERHIMRKLGYVSGTILHYWHGKKKLRQYIDRWDILLRNKFDPQRDIYRDAQGLWQLREYEKPELVKDIIRYFGQRNEDSIDIE